MLQEFRIAHDIIAEHFIIAEHSNSVPGNNNRCSDEEVALLVSLYIRDMGHSSLEIDTAKHIIGNWYFQPIAAYYFRRYPNGDFKRYVSCSDLPLGTDYFK